MLLQYLYAQTGLNRFHSTDLEDMRRALLDEDRDEPDNRRADLSAKKGPQRPLAPRRIARRRPRY